MKFVLAIDGTASSGKSTTARTLARNLGITYLDTGAMYRAVTYLLIKKQALEASDETLKEILLSAPLEFRIEGKRLHVYLDGRELGDELRSPEVDRHVSPAAERKPVRAFLVAKQRKMGESHSLVCEGRDIGSVVFPDADLKVFMTCDAAERARRRTNELEEKGISRDLGEVRRNLEERDRMDSGRKLSPLIRTPEALYVDTTDLSIPQQVSMVEKEAKRLMEKRT